MHRQLPECCKDAQQRPRLRGPMTLCHGCRTTRGAAVLRPLSILLAGCCSNKVAATAGAGLTCTRCGRCIVAARGARHSLEGKPSSVPGARGGLPGGTAAGAGTRGRLLPASTGSGGTWSPASSPSAATPPRAPAPVRRAMVPMLLTGCGGDAAGRGSGGAGRALVSTPGTLAGGSSGGSSGGRSDGCGSEGNRGGAATAAAAVGTPVPTP